MPDEGLLREHFPELPWDQPVLVSVMPESPAMNRLARWACRYCIVMHGLKAQDIINERVPEQVFVTRTEALDHIEREHHD